MEKEEVAREEPTWKMKNEEFSFMFYVFMMLCFEQLLNTWMIFIFVGMVITFTLSSLFFRDRRLGSILNC